MPAKEWAAWDRGVETALIDARGQLLEVNPALRRHLQGLPRTLEELIHPEDWQGLKIGRARVRLQPDQLRCDLTLTALDEGWLAQFHPCPDGDPLREFHHRAKNNLAVISSLLQMQSNLMNDPLVKRAFADCQLRVHCLALLYGQVDQHSGRLDFAVHLGQLLDLLLDGRSASGVNLRRHQLWLSLDQAVPLSLIAHELVANSLRHAWGSRLEIRLDPGPDEQVRFSVADDGPGLPPDLEPDNACSLGLRLIRVLGRQIRAEVTWSSAPGLGCALTFIPKVSP